MNDKLKQIVVIKKKTKIFRPIHIKNHYRKFVRTCVKLSEFCSHAQESGWQVLKEVPAS